MQRRTILIALALIALALSTTTLSGCSRTPTAPSGDAHAVALDGRLSASHLSSSDASNVVAHLRVRLDEGGAHERPAANVALVVDTSGSMKGAALDAAKQAANKLVDALHDGDRLALVSFASHAEVLVPSVELDDDARVMAKERIAAMKALGTTDMAGGLASGLDEVQRHLDATCVNRIVLLGDGIPNSAPEVLALASRAGGAHVTVTAFGLGDEYDETLMGEVAQRSGGRFHDVASADEMVTFFQREALRLDGVVARNASLELTPGPGVRIVAVVGQQMSWHGSRGRVALGDMSRGDNRDLVVRLQAEPHKAGAAVELIDAVLTFDDESGSMAKRHVYLGATATDEQALLDEGRNDEVEHTANRITAAAATVDNLKAHRHGDAQARTRLMEAAARAQQQATDTADAELAEQARQMEELVDNLVELPPEAHASPQPAEGAPKARIMRGKRVVRQAHDDAMKHLQ